MYGWHPCKVIILNIHFCPFMCPILKDHNVNVYACMVEQRWMPGQKCLPWSLEVNRVWMWAYVIMMCTWEHDCHVTSFLVPLWECQLLADFLFEEFFYWKIFYMGFGTILKLLWRAMPCNTKWVKRMYHYLRVLNPWYRSYVIGREAEMVQVHFTLELQDWKVQRDSNGWKLYLASYMAIGV